MPANEVSGERTLQTNLAGGGPFAWQLVQVLKLKKMVLQRRAA